MEFTENLKYLRNAYQFTQKQLADRLGLTANTVCEWEKGRSEPSITTIKKLAEIFDVTVDYLLGLEDDFGARVAPIAPSVNLSEKEKALLAAFNNLLPETQDFILKTAKSLQDGSSKKVKK